MKTNSICFIALLLFSLLSSCKKDSNPTNLELIVNDDSGALVSGASVKLYVSQSDLDNDNNQLASNTTDSNGKVLFTDLTRLKYYWRVVSGCKNNFNGTGTWPSTIAPHATSTVVVVISGTATVQLINQSADSFRISINGKEDYNFAGGESSSKNNVPIGICSFHAVQLSGIAGAPIDTTFFQTLICGDSLVVSFP